MHARPRGGRLGILPLQHAMQCVWGPPSRRHSWIFGCHLWGEWRRQDKVSLHVPQRNYRFFLAFVMTTSVLDVWVHAWCWVRLAWICHHDPARPNLGGAIEQEPAAIALIAYTVLAFACVLRPLACTCNL